MFYGHNCLLFLFVFSNSFRKWWGNKNPSLIFLILRRKFSKKKKKSMFHTSQSSTVNKNLKVTWIKTLSLYQARCLIFYDDFQWSQAHIQDQFWVQPINILIYETNLSLVLLEPTSCSFLQNSHTSNYFLLISPNILPLSKHCPTVCFIFSCEAN